MLETYTQLVLAPTDQFSADALAERNLTIESLRLALFSKVWCYQPKHNFIFNCLQLVTAGLDFLELLCISKCVQKNHETVVAISDFCKVIETLLFTMISAIWIFLINAILSFVKLKWNLTCELIH